MNAIRKKVLLLILLTAATVACQSAPAATPAATTAAATTETAVPEPSTTSSALPTATTTPAMEPTTAVDSSPISDEEINGILFDLLQTNDSNARAAVDRILAANDRRFVSVFIELIRGTQIGIVRNLPLLDYVEALETVSGQSFGQDWSAWVTWYGGTDLTPPPGFLSWKGRMLAGIDPAFAEFLRDSNPTNVRVEEIQWGGVIVDGIPALDNPEMLPAADVDYLEPWEPVFGIAINDDARAYPLRILDWHEMANDVVGGVPVSLAYCTLCGAAIAFDGRNLDADGEPITYTFGSSGFLFRSNKLMYDRQTRTLWNQLTGEPVLGKLVGADITLELLPVVMTTWDEWQRQHPETGVVNIETGFARDYRIGAAYGDYFSNHPAYNDGLMFPVWQQDDRFFNKDHIYALRIDGMPKAYPVTDLVAEGVVNDVLAETAVTLIAPGELITVAGNNRRVGAVTYTTGSEVRAYDRGTHTFSAGPDRDTVLDENGNRWTVTEEALLGPDGESAPRRNGHLAYWFGWVAFYPDTLVYGD